MKLFLGLVLMLGFLQTVSAQETPENDGTTSTTFGGATAEARYNHIRGEGIVDGPIRLCGAVATKQELSKDHLERTVCTKETNTCPPAAASYSCTLTISVDGQKLEPLPLGIAL